jgi:hypothetical protein
VSVTPGERTSTWSAPAAAWTAAPLAEVFCRSGLAARPAGASGSILASRCQVQKSPSEDVIRTGGSGLHVAAGTQGTKRTRWNDGVCCVFRDSFPGRAGLQETRIVAEVQCTDSRSITATSWRKTDVTGCWARPLLCSLRVEPASGQKSERSNMSC